ncbi:hypothetical protein [Nocardioides sp. R-C-SC26]|uniref:hypothetical protein n=1 Tax=Nocardioides sp. R-C-SC26 TaxID=2870414 RepID=UPI001E2B955E|nr:hypothetical protein [Nocardioides sp. R-C-SC26]
MTERSHPGDPGASEDRAWRDIVENFGDRAELEPDRDDEAGAADARDTPATERDPGAGSALVAEPEPTSGSAGPSWDDAFPDDDWSSDRFVPPPPPPVPATTPDRLAAWAGIFGSPAILLICLVLSIEIPTLLAYALVAGFVGGFLYLISQMPREPRDPFDDGARI